MPDLRREPHAEDESVRHLVELGYVDSRDVAKQKVEQRRQQQAQLRRAMACSAAGRGEEAVALLEELTREAPDWALPRQRLAEIHYNASRWKAARAELDWLTYQGIEQPSLALISGGIALAQRNLAAAVEELAYAVFVEPTLPGAHTMLGNALRRLGRWDDAEDAFRNAAEQDPTDAKARDGVATVYLHHNEDEDAADWCLRALEQDMKLFTAHYHLGIALARLGRHAEAVQALETSIRVAPSRIAPYRWLVHIARNSNDSVRADEYEAQAREKIKQRCVRRRHR